MDEESMLAGFWKSAFAFVMLFALLIGFAYTFGRASAIPREHLDAEDEFELLIETIQPFDPPIYPIFNTVSELIGRGQPNLVVRCTAVDREDMTVFDPFRAYDEIYFTYEDGEPFAKYEANFQNLGLNTGLIQVRDPLGGIGPPKDMGEVKDLAATYIATPYEMRIDEVYLGNLLREGDSFTFYAPYGIIGKYAIRYEKFPIFRKGESYVMFLYVTDVKGCGRTYELCSPPAAVRMIDDNHTFETMTPLSDQLFAECEWELEPLVGRIREAYEREPYDLSPLKMEPYGSYDADAES